MYAVVGSINELAARKRETNRPRWSASLRSTLKEHHVRLSLLQKGLRKWLHQVRYANAGANGVRGQRYARTGLKIAASPRRRVRLEELMLACYQRATERNLLPSPLPFPTFTQIVFLHFARNPKIRTTAKVRLANVLDFIIRSRRD